MACPPAGSPAMPSAVLPYAAAGGGNIPNTLGRTIASGDTIQTTTLIVATTRATCLFNGRRILPRKNARVWWRWRADAPELYRRSRITLKEGRVAPPNRPILSVDVNAWWVLHRHDLLPARGVTLCTSTPCWTCSTRPRACISWTSAPTSNPPGLAGFCAQQGRSPGSSAQASASQRCSGWRLRS